MSYNLISIIIPVYNEETTIRGLLDQLLSFQRCSHGFETEIIVIDDGSYDKTSEILRDFHGKVSIFRQPNSGKGAAVQAGISRSNGDWILVQDGDLEYDINDINLMLDVVRSNLNGKVAVYGSRYKSHRKFIFKRIKKQKFGPYLINILLSLLTLALFRAWLTDTLTGYKIYKREFFDGLTINSKGFEADHEITCLLLGRGYRIIEVPVRYNPRSRAEGKKIKAIDGLKAILTFFRYAHKGKSD